MYKVYIDGRPLYVPGDEYAVIMESVAKQSLNDAGSFEFSIPELNPEYENLQVRSSMIQVLKDNKEIFYGQINEIEQSIDKVKQVCAIGELAFLFDSIQPQAVYSDITPRQLLETWLNIHNSQVEERKKFYTGIVTAKGSNESMSSYTDRETTLDCIREVLCEKTQGYLRIRKKDGKRYLDLVELKDYGKICEQPVYFGKNLLDYAENISGSEIATACIPRGGRLDDSTVEGLDAYTDITSVNEGRDYIFLPEAVEKYGWIRKAVDFDDVFIPSVLKSKAEEWLTNVQYENMTLEVTALDLSVLKTDMDSWELGDSVRAVAKPFGLDRYFPVNEREIHLQNPEADSMKLGTTVKKGYVGQSQDSETSFKGELEKVHQTSTFLQSAVDNATQMLTGNKGGYKITEYDEEHRFLRDLYMDAINKEDAVNIMQIGPKGIGLSTQGIEGPYEDAWVLGLGLNAKYIAAGTIKAEALSTEYRQSVTKEIKDADNETIKYVQSETKASIEAVEDKISLKVSEEVSNVMHDYCVNGKFKDGIEGWYVSNSSYLGVYQSSLGKCIRFTGASVYGFLRQGIQITAGKYKVRFKAATEAGYESRAKIKCEFNDSTSWTLDGELKSKEWTQIEFNYTVDTDGTTYIYLYDDAQGIPVWITDIQILGGYEKYNEAQIKVMSTSIESRVSIDNVGSYVGQYYDRVIAAFNKDSKYIQIEAGEISVYDSEIKDSKKRAAFNEEGISFWRDGYNLGYIGASKQYENESYKGLVLNLNINGKFMCWGYEESTTDPYYTMMLYFFTRANISDNPYPGIYLGHDMYANGYTISLDSNGRTWTHGYIDGASIRTKDTFWIENGSGDSIAQFCDSDIYLFRNTYADVVGTPSDERLKKNITDSKMKALDVISMFDFREFDWIESGLHESLGLVAQEVEAIIPDLVSNSNNGVKYINPTRLLWYCAKAIQEIYERLDNTAIKKSLNINAKLNKMTEDEKREWIASIKECSRPIDAKPHTLKIPIKRKGRDSSGK